MKLPKRNENSRKIENEINSKVESKKVKLHKISKGT